MHRRMQMQRLAGAKIPCQCECHRSSTAPTIPCDCCDVDGRRYFFPETVRVPVIVHCHPLNRRELICDLEVEDCSGHVNGWTAATDGWVWWQAARTVGIHIRFDNGPNGNDYYQAQNDPPVGWRHQSTDPETAFFAALTRAVEAYPGIVLED